jgi:hypothetical protein
VPPISCSVTASPTRKRMDWGKAERGDETYRQEVSAADRESVRQLVQATGFFSKGGGDRRRAVANGSAAVKGAAIFSFAEEEGRFLGYACFGPSPVPPTATTSTGLQWIRRASKGGRKEPDREAEGIVQPEGGTGSKQIRPPGPNTRLPGLSTGPAVCPGGPADRLLRPRRWEGHFVKVLTP